MDEYLTYAVFAVVALLIVVVIYLEILRRCLNGLWQATYDVKTEVGGLAVELSTPRKRGFSEEF